MESTEARERVLDAAEVLFARRGYTAVTLRDVAREVGIRHTSLYHHVPGGKEALFIEVTERMLRRHQVGLSEAIQAAGPDVRDQLRAVAGWLLSQPPMDLIRMVYSDMPAIDPTHAARLSQAAYDAMLSPIEAALRRVQQQGQIEPQSFGLIAGGFLGMVESLYSVPDYVLTRSRLEMAHELIDVLLDGLRPRAKE